MSVTTIPVTQQVPKEGKEIVDAITGLLKHFLHGGSLEGAGAFLPAVMTAVDGYQKVSEEIASEFRDELGGYLTQKLWESLEK